MPEFSPEADADHDQGFANFGDFQTHDDLAFPDVDQSAAGVTSNVPTGTSLKQSQSTTSFEFSGWSKTQRSAADDTQSAKSLDFKQAPPAAAASSGSEQLQPAADARSTTSVDAK